MKTLTVRFDDDVYNEICELAKITGNSKNSIINLCVRDEYQKVGQDPKIKLAFEKLNEIKKTFESLNEQLNA